MIQKTEPAKKLAGTLVMPPDKSISHRSALFAAISSSTSVIDNYSTAADPQSTLSCLRQLGVSIHAEGQRVEIKGVGRDGFKIPDAPLDCGNSGTTMRLLSGILAGAGIECEMVGDESLSARTMKRIIDPLRQMGCAIEGREQKFAPLKIGKNTGIKSMRYPLPIASAQLKSCVLLAGLFGDEPTEVIETLPSRDHTERLLKLSITEKGEEKHIYSSKTDAIPEQSYRIPNDFSAAAFWLVAGAIHPRAEIGLDSVGMNPTRTGALDILQKMGADLTIKKSRNEGAEPIADISISTSMLKPIDITEEIVPNCID